MDQRVDQRVSNLLTIADRRSLQMLSLCHLALAACSDKECRGANITGVDDAEIFARFTKRVQRNLHIVFTMTLAMV